MAITSSVPGEEHDAGWFPSWFMWPLFFLTSALRVYYVMQPKNWWILHPDEVYQALEVAHSEMYGYGFRAYEYNPPPEVGLDSPHILQHELRHGLYALRSYLLPHAYVTVMWVLELLGMRFTPFLTWKVAHTLAASTLPLAVYRYVRVVFRSHDTACLAALLCVCSALLHVLGTHTLVNSLLSAPVFWALAHVHTLISPPPHQQELSHSAAMQQGVHRKGKSPASRRVSQTRASTNGQLSQQGSAKPQNGAPKTRGKPKPARPGQKQRWTPSGNGVTHRGAVNNNGVVPPAHDCRAASDAAATENSCSPVNGDVNGAAQQFSNKHSAQTDDRLATTDVCVRTPFKRKCVGVLLNLGVGLVLGVCVYIRVDVAALGVLTLFPHWSPLRTRYVDVIVCGLGSAFGLGVGVVDDLWCYGWGVVTPYNWYKFNVQNDYSALLFGTNDLHQYVSEIFFDNAGMMALSAVCCVCGVLHVLRPLQPPLCVGGGWQQGGAETGVGLNPGWRGGVVRICVSWILLLALYSSKGHKELRFAHNVIVLVLVTWAVLLQSGVLRLTSFPEKRKLALLAVSVASFALSQWQDVAGLTDRPERGGNKMAFKQAGDTQDVNQCLYYLSSRQDLTGVFLDRNLYATGGYTLLHRDVPVFTIFGPNFMEFRPEDRVVERAKNVFGPPRNISVAYVGRFSNYITPQHSTHVFKYVLQDARYNYIVSLANRDMSDFGFGESVFRCGTYKVYHRPAKPSPLQRQRIQATLDSRPRANVNALLHEADMMLYHGAYRSACDRFRRLLSIDPTQVGAYLTLAASHSRLGELAESSAVMAECYAKFDRRECDKKRKPLLSSSSV